MRFELILPPSFRRDLSEAPSSVVRRRSSVLLCFSGGGGGSPPARDLYSETSGELKAKLDLQPQLLAAETAYRPQYATLDLQAIQSLLDGSKGGTSSQYYTDVEHVPAQFGLVGSGRSARRVQTAPAYDRPVLKTREITTPEQKGLLDLFENDFLPANNRITTASRQADINDVATLGPQATAAYKASNPDQAALLDKLNEQARSELDAGANLDPSLAREVSQSVRAGQSARGMGMGLNDLANESFFTGLQAEQLRRARQAFATGVVGLNQANTVDPFLATLGRPSVAMGQANSFLGQGFGLNRSAGPQLFGSSVNANDVADSNFNAANARSIADRNNSAALQSSAIGGGAALAGSAILAVAL